MKAVVITTPGDPSVLKLEEVDEPSLPPGHVKVKVKAAGCNRADLMQRTGNYRPAGAARADIPGLEFSGEVESNGAGAERYARGARVAGMASGGAYAETVVVPEGLLMSIPEALSFVEAASIPLVFLTAFDALFEQLQVSIGDDFLVHGAGSGVGTAAVQLARTAGCRVFGTAGSDAKLSRAAELGLDVGINYHKEDFSEVVHSRTGGNGVQAILDMVGAPYWEKNLQSLAPLGRILFVGFLGGARVEADLSVILRKRLRVMGTVLGSRSVEDRVLLTRKFERRILPLFSEGRLKTVVDREFPLSEASQAHTYLEENRNFGKVVLQVA